MLKYAATEESAHCMLTYAATLILVSKEIVEQKNYWVEIKVSKVIDSQ